MDPALTSAEVVLYSGHGQAGIGLEWVWNGSSVVNIRKGCRITKALAGWGWLGYMVSEIRESWRVVTGGKGILKGLR